MSIEDKIKALESGNPELLTDSQGYMLEAALQVGFEMVNDDGNVYLCNDAQIIDLMTRARDAGRQCGKMETANADALVVLTEKHLLAAADALNIRAFMAEDEHGASASSVELRKLADDFATLRMMVRK